MKSIFSLVVFLCVGLLIAQQPYKKEDLRNQSRALNQQIAELNKSLNENRTVSNKSLLYIKNLDDKIKAQSELVSVTIKERKVLEDEIYLSQLEINKLRRELEELKKEYKDVLINAYKNKGMQNKMLFVLSSKSFTEAYRRIKYLEKYAGFQGQKSDEISEKTKAIEATIASREQAILDKENVLAKQRVLRETLEKEKAEQNTILAEYRKNEGAIRKEIANRQAQSKELEAEIQRIIEEEIRIAREKEEAERRAREEAARLERERLARIEAERLERERKEREEAIAAGRPAPEPVPVPEPEPVVTPEPIYAERTAAEALGSSFEASQGKLPWPVTKGDVVGRFGRVPHVALPGVVENHAGVLIATSRGSKARAVYDGHVQAIMALKGGNNAVMISHGTYFTVYNNLTNLLVSKGDKIKRGQELGSIYTDTDNNTILDFQVWRYTSSGTSKQDPAKWVSGM